MSMTRKPSAQGAGGSDSSPKRRGIREASPFRVVAFDPGGTTGWASAEWLPFMTTDPLTSLDQIKFECGQLGPDEHHLQLWNFLDKWIHLQRYGRVVYESFEFRQHINPDHTKTKVELISKEYIGVIKLFCEQNNFAPTSYTASAAKHFIPDKGPQANARLKALGLYVPARVHAMDAFRHLLRYLVVDMRIREPITDKWL